jgi:hypothetical protein
VFICSFSLSREPGASWIARLEHSDEIDDSDTILFLKEMAPLGLPVVHPRAAAAFQIDKIKLIAHVFDASVPSRRGHAFDDDVAVRSAAKKNYLFIERDQFASA